MKISTTLVTFRIDIDFEDCEVDMVLKKMHNAGVQTPIPSILTDGAKIPIDKSKLSKTPTMASVEFALNWLWGFVDEREMCVTSGKYRKQTELEQIGVSVTDIYGLMQGTCHLICETEIEHFNNDLVNKSQEIVEKVFKKYIRYHKQN